MVLRDRFMRFQVNKRQVLRRVSEDVLATLSEVERETVASTRHSLFGDREAAGYEVLANRLIFADSSQDPFLQGRALRAVWELRSRSRSFRACGGDRQEIF